MKKYSFILCLGALIWAAPISASSLSYWFNDQSDANITFYATIAKDSAPVTITQGSSNTRPSYANAIVNEKNAYAPNIIRNGGVWNLYYGGWLSSTADTDPDYEHDQIYIQVSNNLELTGGLYPKQLVIPHGPFFHVNDPNVTRRSSTDWVMVYTAAATTSTYSERIGYSTSTDGGSWTPASTSNLVNINYNGTETLKTSARPALVYRNGIWYMWFDGWVANNSNDPENLWMFRKFLATSTQAGTPNTFTVIHTFYDSGFSMTEADVKVRNDGSFLATYLHETDGSNVRREIFLATSTDGINWTGVRDRKAIDTRSDTGVSQPYLSNPGLIYDESDDRVWGILYSGDPTGELGRHNIYVAYNVLEVSVRSPGDVWHTWNVSGMNAETRVNTGDYKSFDWVKIRNPTTGAIFYDAAFVGAAGDRFIFNL